MMWIIFRYSAEMSFALHGTQDHRGVCGVHTSQDFSSCDSTVMDCAPVRTQQSPFLKEALLLLLESIAHQSPSSYCDIIKHIWSPPRFLEQSA